MLNILGEIATLPLVAFQNKTTELIILKRQTETFLGIISLCETFFDSLVVQEDFDTEQMSALASCLSELFKDHFRGEVLPDEITEE